MGRAHKLPPSTPHTVSDEVHDLRHIVGAAPLIHDGQWCIIQLLGKGTRPEDRVQG